MVKRKLLLDALAPSNIEGLPAGISALPVEVTKGKRVFVFMLAGEERELFSNEQVQNMAQTLGNVVHPAQAVFIVVPKGAVLTAYEVRG